MIIKKYNITRFYFLVFIFYFLLSGVTVQAQGVSSLKRGLREAAGEANLVETRTIPTLIGTIIGSVLTVMGVLFFLLSVYGGFLWMTARGNEERVTRGKNTIIAAVIGMIIIVASYAVTRLVLGSTSTDEGFSPARVSCTQEADCPGKTCRGGYCVSLGSCQDDSNCGTGEYCDAGVCSVEAFVPADNRNTQCVNRPGVSEPAGAEPCDFLTNSECSASSYCELQ
jgi:uncharacterized membrane protein YidH (DUF202 family)